MNEPTTRVVMEQMDQIDMSVPVEIDLEQLRQQWQYLAGAKHTWSIGATYHIEAPETALDNMVLGPESLIGFTPIHCLWCQVPYQQDIREAKCLGKNALDKIRDKGATPHLPCPKCGSDNVTMYHCDFGHPEHFHRTCQQCKFKWQTDDVLTDS